MEIIWHGQNCFTLKGTDATVVTDPYRDNGLTLPKLKAQIVTVSENTPGYGNVAAVEGEPRVFEWPGEYESQGVLMSGFESAGKRIFHMEIDGIRIAHMGRLEAKLSEEVIEALGDVDVLMIPVGGGDAIDHKLAHQVIEQIEPRVVIPMHYMIDGLKADVAGVDLFLKEMGSHGEPQEKWVIKGRSTLPEEAMQFVVLVPQVG